MIKLLELLEEVTTYSGKDVANHIKSITPKKSDVPDYFLRKYVLPNDGWKLETVNISDLLNDDDFKDYYESNEERYNPKKVSEKNLNIPIVIYKNQVIDGYSRASRKLRMGDKKIEAYILQ